MNKWGSHHVFLLSVCFPIYRHKTKRNVPFLKMKAQTGKGIRISPNVLLSAALFMIVVGEKMETNETSALIIESPGLSLSLAEGGR